MFSSALCQAALQRMAQQTPEFHVFPIAVTRYRRRVWAARLGKGQRRILFTGAFHANEWLTALILLRYCRQLLCTALPCQLCVVPLMNPDGVDLVTGAVPQDSDQYHHAASIAAGFPRIPFPHGWKANGSGVDLNLNFPADFTQAQQVKAQLGFTAPAPCNWPGLAPLNQPETRGLAELTRRFEPHLVVALHTQGQELYWRSNAFVPAEAEKLGQLMAQRSGYTLCDPPQASSYAGYKDWFIRCFHRPGYTVEAGLGTNPLPIQDFPKIYPQVEAILTTALWGC